jgi:hypothetical protein
MLWASPSTATLSGSGTVSPASPSVTYAGGTYSISNPTPPVSGAGGVTISPVCNDDICDRYLVTVADIPSDYGTTHPLDRLLFRAQWPDLDADFDLWVYDSTGSAVVTRSASSANPEIASLPLAAGTTRYVMRVVPFTVLPTGDGFTGSVAIGALPPPPDVYGPASHVAGIDVFSCNLHLTGIDETGASHASDKEPAVRFDADGIAYLTSNGDGSGLWTVTDPCGAEATFLGLADLSNGGGDTDVEVGSIKNANGYYNVYSSSLHSTDALVNINSSVSYDGGQTFLTTPVSDPTPVNDRNWNATYGKDYYYLSYRTLNTGNQQFVVRAQATEGQPMIMSPPVPVYTSPNVLAEAGYQVGNMVADQRPLPPLTPPLTAGADGQGNVYHGFLTASGAHIYVAVSRDFGTTWTDTKVFDAPGTQRFNHIFTWVAVDAAGNVYTCFADDRDIYYSVSSDIKTSNTPHWSTPVRVSEGPSTKSSALPTMAAGSAGRLVFSWYGSPATSSQDANAQWYVFFARCDNALDALSPGGVPVMEQVLVSDHIVHEGALCQAGTLGCSGNTRALLDDYEIDINPTDGASLITFTDDGPVGGTFVTRQLAGKSSIAGKTVTDRSAVCTVAAEYCAGAPEPRGNYCDNPGYRVVDDAPNDAGGNFGSLQTDILKIYVAEPHRADNVEKITFTIRVAALNPDSLPLNTIWRAFYTVPTVPETTYFVSMSTCRPTQIPSFDFGFTNPTTGTQTGLGTADEGEVTPSGDIRVTMSKHRVGNSTTAGNVLFHADIGSNIRSIKGTTYFLEGANCSGLLEAIDQTGSGTYHVSGNCSVVGVDPGGPTSGLSLALGGGNPFRGSTELRYALPRACRVRMAVYGIDGRRLCTLVDGHQTAGPHAVPFDLERSAGRTLGPGVYLVRIDADGERRTLRAIGLR